MSPKTMGSAFTGTAPFYASYRPPYPNELLARLRLAARTTGNGVLLDLACSPGRIAIPMAPHFRRVVADDFQMRVETVWTTDTLVGFMRSTSFASGAALGQRAAHFEADLRRALLQFAPADQFPASQRFGYTLATRRVAVE